MSENTKRKLIAALKRAGHTMAQTAIATIGTAAVLEAVNWHVVLSASLLAGLLSLLKSVVIGVPEAGDETDQEPDYFDGTARFDDEEEI